MIFEPRMIIAHHSLTEDGRVVNTGAIFDWHTGRNPASPYRWAYPGYHFLCEFARDRYHVFAGAPLDEVGRHTRGYNSIAIGFCFIGNYDVQAPPDEMLKIGARHIQGLMRIFKIPKGELYGHRDFDPKSCPGDMFDLDRLKSFIKYP